jgi:hypothetical protein
MVILCRLHCGDAERADQFGICAAAFDWMVRIGAKALLKKYAANESLRLERQVRQLKRRSPEFKFYQGGEFGL